MGFCGRNCKNDVFIKYIGSIEYKMIMKTPSEVAQYDIVILSFSQYRNKQPEIHRDSEGGTTGGEPTHSGSIDNRRNHEEHANRKRLLSRYYL